MQGTPLSTLHVLTLWIFTSTLRYYFYPKFIDEETGKESLHIGEMKKKLKKKDAITHSEVGDQWKEDWGRQLHSVSRKQQTNQKRK